MMRVKTEYDFAVRSVKHKTPRGYVYLMHIEEAGGGKEGFWNQIKQKLARLLKTGQR